MPYPFPPEIAERIRRRITSGQFPSEDEVLKAALRALDERDEQLAAIQVGLADWPPGFIESTAGAWQGDFPDVARSSTRAAL